MAKKRPKMDKTGFTESGLPTEETVNKSVSRITGQPEKKTVTGPIYSLEDLKPKKKEKTRDYVSRGGRKRLNTMMHPELKKILDTIADNNNETLPDVMEKIICAHLGIDTFTDNV